MDFCKNAQCPLRGCNCQSGLDMRRNMSDNCNNCNDNCDNCNDKCDAPRLENAALAMVYCPDHDFDCMYSPDDGLEAGTMFRGLDKPFLGRTIYGGAL